jgi:signal peptidase I
MPAATPQQASRSIWKTVLNRLLGRSSKPTTNPHDPLREGLETIVFVVVLVFLLKQFVVEAFVIPTGSMAETLYGDNKVVTCSDCGFKFPLNSHSEVAAEAGTRARPIEGYCCPNCRFKQTFRGAPSVPSNNSGDRVLVLKAIYHREPAKPGDVVVFKFPEGPQKDFEAVNYIKRMWATGGQTLAIWRGDLYVCDTLKYPLGTAYALRDNTKKYASLPEDPKDLWKKEYTYYDAEIALKLFEESRLAGFPENGPGFKLIRKSETLIEEMKRVVYDNEHQSKTLVEKGVPPRWKADSADWKADAANKVFTHSGGTLGWLRYRHLVVDDWHDLGPDGKPVATQRLIDNFLGYNGEYGPGVPNTSEDSKYWVGDLIVECQANITDADAQVALELSKGPNRFQAIFKGGTVTLMRTGVGGKQLAQATTPISGPGKYTLRFANVDCRLHVWVNGKAVKFDAPVDYAPTLPEPFDPADEKKEGWITANDIDQPVSIGATGGVEVSKLKIWRDTYFINELYGRASRVASTVATYYVHEGHYLCLGDNSSHSSDSRYWGTVPERLLLGKAVFIFWPLDRIGLIK